MLFDEDIAFVTNLITKNILDKAQYERLLKILKENQNKTCTEVLIEEFGISDNLIKKEIATYYNIPEVVLSDAHITLKENLISSVTCTKYRIIPVNVMGTELTVAFINPPYKNLLELLKQEAKKVIVPVVISHTNFKDLLKIFNKVEQAKITSKINLEQYDARKVSKDKILEAHKLGRLPSIETLLDEIIIQSINANAHDIHFETLENELRIRIDKDGVLERLVSFPKEFIEFFGNVIKTKGGLNTFERKKPQEGAYTVEFGDKEIDIRIITLPTLHGERIALRLFLKKATIKPIEDLGFLQKDLENMLYLLNKPFGLILVTGPASSGKSTTLYAMVSELNNPQKNIITVEDPVEFKLDFATQIKIDADTSLNFTETMKAILKQRPNVIMLSEIRDADTGTIAAEAALNGNLVLSTMLADSAIGAIPRLSHLGIPAHWLAPTLLGIINQKLVRKICPLCKEEYIPSSEELRRVGIQDTSIELKFYRGKGCSNCGGTGYSGRTIIYEILVVDEELKNIIYQDSSARKLKETAVSGGFKNIRYNAVKKILIGEITTSEVIRALG
ncbi:MAG: General secretion pathway protein E [Ignavibacteriae bacterium]|nr:MAG: General secretion pathway protein E [Ignavibacteriota bacterium]